MMVGEGTFTEIMIDCCPCASTKKARIMNARETGHLDDLETEQWICLAGLEAA